MDLGFLSFLGEPWFVLPWYGAGLLAAAWVARDEYTANRRVNGALAWAWPIIALFFSVLGLALYLWTCRPPRLGALAGEEEARVHHEYVSTPARKVVGSAIHCVAGDGLGIVTAMVVARLVGLSFWEELWLEFAAGFAIGWLVFQLQAMRDMGHGLAGALWRGARGELLSMLTVMAGMGAVMGFVTPLVVGEQPHPLTWAFWGFGALGLGVGFLLTCPMSRGLVAIGWKHGMS